MRIKFDLIILNANYLLLGWIPFSFPLYIKKIGLTKKKRPCEAHFGLQVLWAQSKRSIEFELEACNFCSCEIGSVSVKKSAQHSPRKAMQICNVNLEICINVNLEICNFWETPCVIQNETLYSQG